MYGVCGTHVHDGFYLQVEFYSAVDGRQIWLDGSQVHVDASQRREGGGGKPGGSEKLVNGMSKTADVKHMWTHPYSQGDTLTLTFTLPPHPPPAKFKVWNYNGAICVCDGCVVVGVSSIICLTGHRSEAG